MPRAACHGLGTAAGRAVHRQRSGAHCRSLRAVHRAWMGHRDGGRGGIALGSAPGGGLHRVGVRRGIRGDGPGVGDSGRSRHGAVRAAALLHGGAGVAPGAARAAGHGKRRGSGRLLRDPAFHVPAAGQPAVRGPVPVPRGVRLLAALRRGGRRAGIRLPGHRARGRGGAVRAALAAGVSGRSAGAGFGAAGGRPEAHTRRWGA